LIHRPQPSSELLSAVKDALSSRYKAADGAFSTDVLIGGYIACIARALVDTGELISRKSAGELESDLRWLSDAAWLDDAL
jgi:hypothetical protein